MGPHVRKFALTAHITLSVGWLGAVAAYLALAVVGLAGHDPEVVRACYLTMDVLVRFIIVPLSLTSLLVGLIVGLETPWGLVRYWWVLAKLLLTTVAIIVLLQHVEAVASMASIARETTLTAGGYRDLRVQLVVHAAGGLLVLLAVTALSVYKPWGMTPYGRRTMRTPRPVSRAFVRSPEPADVGAGTIVRTPRWTYIIAIHAVGLVLMFIGLHLVGGGLRH